MFDFIAQHVSGSPLTYLLIIGVTAGDAVFPLFPAEVVVITASVLAANGRLQIVLVALAAIAGAVLGDNCAYGLGRGGLRRLADRLLHSPGFQDKLRWARGQLQSRGAWIIIIARFIPGGRTATTYVAGTLRMQWRRRFLPADTAAGTIWSLYACALGYFGGAAFEHNLWLPLVIATGASVLVAIGGELVRRRLADRQAR